MSETQAYRLRFTPDSFVAIDFSNRTIDPTDDEGVPTCGGVWCRKFGLKSPAPEMGLAERRAVQDYNRAKIQDAGADPHQMHKQIVMSAIRLGAAPENLLSYAHAIGPKSEMPDTPATSAGNMEIEKEVSKEIDGEIVRKMIKVFVPIVSCLGIIPHNPGEHVQVTRLPPSWTLEKI